MALREHLISFLRSQTIKQLQNTASNLGIRVSTHERASKGSIIEAMVLDLMADTCDDDCTVISIDIGIKHLAYTVISSSFEIFAWELHDLSQPTFDIVRLSKKIDSFVDGYLKPWMRGRFVIIIEDQYVRGMKTPFSIIVNNIIAGQLHIALQPFTKVIRPQLVAEITGMKHLKYKEKKSASVKYATNLLLTFPFVYNNNVLGDWNESNKKDDLSDCLIQAYVFIQWQQRRRHFIAELESMQEEETSEVIVISD